MAEIQKLSHRHEAIMQYLVSNPEMKLQDVAREFGVTQPWLSTLIHSGLFQRRLHEVQGTLTDEICFGIKDKLQELAHESLDRLLIRIQAGAIETDDMLDIAEMAVKNTLGAVPAKNGVSPQATFQQNFFVTPEDLSQARELMYQRRGGNLLSLKEIQEVNAEQVPQVSSDAGE